MLGLRRVDEDHVAHVILDECVACGACVNVCPNVCIAEDEDSFVIDPGRCGDCHQCVAVCPVECILGTPAECASTAD